MTEKQEKLYVGNMIISYFNYFFDNELGTNKVKIVENLFPLYNGNNVCFPRFVLEGFYYIKYNELRRNMILILKLINNMETKKVWDIIKKWCGIDGILNFIWIIWLYRKLNPDIKNNDELNNFISKYLDIYLSVTKIALGNYLDILKIIRNKLFKPMNETQLELLDEYVYYDYFGG